MTIRAALSIATHNVPLINLRWEFRDNFIFIESLDDQQYSIHDEPLETPMFVWLGMYNAGFGLIIQRSVIGLESYVRGACWERFAVLGSSPRQRSFLKNPFRLGGKSAADRLYNRLVAEVDPSFALCKHSETLWEDVREFYKVVRNPLFHGKEMEGVQLDSVKDSMELIQEVYRWIDSWCDPSFLGSNIADTLDPRSA